MKSGKLRKICNIRLETGGPYCSRGQAQQSPASGLGTRLSTGPTDATLLPGRRAKGHNGSETKCILTDIGGLARRATADRISLVEDDAPGARRFASPDRVEPRDQLALCIAHRAGA